MIKFLAVAIMLFSCSSSNNNKHTMTEKQNNPSNIYSFSVDGLSGGKINLADFKGKKILIVNTASKCGYTPQYQELETLYNKYQDKLVIIGFPANNFGGQEPGTNAEIETFCQQNYGVSFPMAAKISVKGNDMAPIYQWLTQKNKNGVLDAEIGWNFNKFLIDENGIMMAHFPSKVTPLSTEIVSKL